MSLMALPMILCNKDDAIGDDFLEVKNPDDPEEMKKFQENWKRQMSRAFRNEPQIKIVMGGNFLELVDDGVFKL